MARQTKRRVLCKSKPFLKKRIGITTGNPEGIGRIIARRSLEVLGPKKNYQFVIWTSNDQKALNVKGFKTRVFKSAEEALASPFSSYNLLEVKNAKKAGDWFEEACYLGIKKELSALVTGPISKALMKKNRFRAKGHTDLLKKILKNDEVFMTFFGRHFNLILLTDHIPLSEVSLDLKKLESLIRKALELRAFLKPSNRKKPLGLLGLNPHAGEGGILGQEEKKLKPLLLKFKKELRGPLVPDSAFIKKNWDCFSFYISLYHDQGLIPFKTIHNHTGSAFSLGVPFIRTGVDHGTGLGLKPKDVNHESFLLALKKALSLSLRSNPSFFKDSDKPKKI